MQNPTRNPLHARPRPTALAAADRAQPERRQHERRQSSVLLNWRHLGFRGRRHRVRRDGDHSRPYVDRYERKLMYLVLAVVTLSCADAFITLRLLELGAVELNSLMAYLIERDVRTFIVYKFALTSLALVVLVVYSNFRLFGRLQVVTLLWWALFIYILLILYELVLLAIGLYSHQ